MRPSGRDLGHFFFVICIEILSLTLLCPGHWTWHFSSLSTWNHTLSLNSPFSISSLLFLFFSPRGICFSCCHYRLLLDLNLCICNFLCLEHPDLCHLTGCILSFRLYPKSLPQGPAFHLHLKLVALVFICCDRNTCACSLHSAGKKIISHDAKY